MFLDNFFKPKKIGIDIGSEKIYFYLEDKGIVISDYTYIAVNTKNDSVFAIGKEAKEMSGRVPPYIKIIKPVLNGVIYDFEAMQALLNHYFKEIREKYSNLFGYEALVAISLDMTEVQKKSFEDILFSVGMKKVYSVPKVIAAAVASRCDVLESVGNMIVEYGSSKLEIATVSTGGIIYSKSLNIGGYDIDNSIISQIKNNYSISIGELMAEKLKKSLSSSDKEKDVIIKGRDVSTGMPKQVNIRVADIVFATEKYIEIIAENIKLVLENIPTEILSDIYEKGIMLSGDSSRLFNYKKKLKNLVRLDMYIVDDPATSVIRGLGILIGKMDEYSLVINKIR